MEVITLNSVTIFGLRRILPSSGPEIIIKMTSLLNFSDSSKSEELNLKDIQVLVDNKEQNSFRTAYVGKFLGLVHIHKSTARLADEHQKTRTFLQAVGGCHNVTSTSEDAQDHNIIISLTGTLHVLVNSRKDKVKALKRLILKDIVPRGFDARIQEIQEKQQQAIEEKDPALALLTNDLQACDNQIQALEFTNEKERQAHQQQILRLNEEINNLIANRHVARR